MITIIPYSAFGRIELDVSNKKKNRSPENIAYLTSHTAAQKEGMAHIQCYRLKEAGLNWNVLHAALSVQSLLCYDRSARAFGGSGSFLAFTIRYSNLSWYKTEF